MGLVLVTILVTQIALFLLEYWHQKINDATTTWMDGLAPIWSVQEFVKSTRAL